MKKEEMINFIEEITNERKEEGLWQILLEDIKKNGYSYISFSNFQIFSREFEKAISFLPNLNLWKINGFLREIGEGPFIDEITMLHSVKYAVLYSEREIKFISIYLWRDEGYFFGTIKNFLQMQEKDNFKKSIGKWIEKLITRKEKKNEFNLEITKNKFCSKKQRTD